MRRPAIQCPPRANRRTPDPSYSGATPRLSVPVRVWGAVTGGIDRPASFRWLGSCLDALVSTDFVPFGDSENIVQLGCARVQCIKVSSASPNAGDRQTRSPEIEVLKSRS